MLDIAVRRGPIATDYIAYLLPSPRTCFAVGFAGNIYFTMWRRGRAFLPLRSAMPLHSRRSRRFARSWPHLRFIVASYRAYDSMLRCRVYRARCKYTLITRWRQPCHVAVSDLPSAVLTCRKFVARRPHFQPDEIFFVAL